MSIALFIITAGLATTLYEGKPWQLVEAPKLERIELPELGIALSLLGAPFFLALLLRMRRGLA